MTKLPTDNGMEKRTVVLMMTCKRYDQVWEPFVTLFKKYWPDCPYRFAMGTDIGNYPGVEVIELGKDYGWSDNCIEILKRLKEDRVILFFEDFLPTEPFDTKRVRELVRHSIDHNVACLRLAPCPGPTAPWHATDIVGVLQPQDPYRLSLQAAIWDREVLLQLLMPGENGWETEINGTARASRRSEPFLSVWRGESPTPYFITAVVKGKWEDGAIDLLKKEGISLKNITKVIP